MKLDTLIKLLQVARREGSKEVFFSSDEEGNTILEDCYTMYYDSEKRIAIYPFKRKE